MSIDSQYDYIFTDQLRQHFGKLTASELEQCQKPNYLRDICKVDIPMQTLQLNKDCEPNLLHPCITSLPQQ